MKVEGLHKRIHEHHDLVKEIKKFYELHEAAVLISAAVFGVLVFSAILMLIAL